MKILLSYGYTPYTTGWYIERALRQDHEVFTLGTSNNGHHDNEMENGQDLSKCLVVGDLFLWVEGSGRVPNFPKGIDKLKIPTACYMIDSHTQLMWHVNWAKQFSFVFVAQKEYIPAFERAGCKNVSWLPLACDPEIHKPHEWKSEKYDIGFIGNVYEGSGIYKRRRDLIEKLKRNFDVYVTTAYGEDMSKELSKCKIAFNCAVKNDLNMRVFEAMATGVPLLTDEAVGLTELFDSYQHFVYYNDKDLIPMVKEYLAKPELLDRVSKLGMDEVLTNHTYRRRCHYIMNVIERHKRKQASIESKKQLDKDVPGWDDWDKPSLPLFKN